MTGGNRLAGVTTHYDLAGPDADPELRESRPPVVLELGSQLGKSLTNLDGGPHGTQRIVLVDRRNTKNGGQPSPIDFSTVAPCRASTGSTTSKPRAASLCSASGSSSRPDGATSQDSTVTVFRACRTRAGVGEPMDAVCFLAELKRLFRRIECRSLGQNPPLQFLELCSWLEPELLGELRSSRLVRVKSRGWRPDR